MVAHGIPELALPLWMWVTCRGPCLAQSLPSLSWKLGSASWSLDPWVGSRTHNLFGTHSCSWQHLRALCAVPASSSALRDGLTCLSSLCPAGVRLSRRSRNPPVLPRNSLSKCLARLLPVTTELQLLQCFCAEPGTDVCAAEWAAGSLEPLGEPTPLLVWFRTSTG